MSSSDSQTLGLGENEKCQFYTRQPLPLACFCSVDFLHREKGQQLCHVYHRVDKKLNFKFILEHT